MTTWPPIEGARLRDRLAMDDERFLELYLQLLEASSPRVFADDHYETVIGYPWARDLGSYLLSDAGVEQLDEVEERAAAYTAADGSGPARFPLLAYGANRSPERLSMRFAGLPDGHRDALVLGATLAGFDVGVTAIPPVWAAMPGTLIPSPEARVRVTVLLVTAVQFEELTKMELSYRVGALEPVEVVPDLGGISIGRAFAFVSRFGALRVDGTPIVMQAIPAEGRSYPALTQVEILDAGARLCLGEAARGADLIRAAFEQPTGFMAEHYPKFRSAAFDFESPLWTPMP